MEKPNQSITLDLIDNLNINEKSKKQYLNEYQTLDHLQDGLNFLYSTFVEIENKLSTPNVQTFVLGNFPGTETDDEFFKDFDDKTLKALNYYPTLNKGLVTCSLHWFANTICNYVRLIGWLGYDESVSKAQSYVKKILPDISVWRNKVSAHFARIDPKKNDTPATLFQSTTLPWSVSKGKIITSALTFKKIESGQEHLSEINPWILTEEYKKLDKRFSFSRKKSS